MAIALWYTGSSSVKMKTSSALRFGRRSLTNPLRTIAGYRMPTNRLLSTQTPAEEEHRAKIQLIDHRTLFRHPRIAPPTGFIDITIGNESYAVPKGLSDGKITEALNCTHKQDKRGASREQELREFPPGRAAVGRMLLQWLVIDEVPRVQDFGETHPELAPETESLSKEHVRYSITLVKAWELGHQYGLVQFQNAVMLQLLRTLNDCYILTPDIVLAAYDLPLHKGIYKMQDDSECGEGLTAKSPTRLAMINAARLAWYSNGSLESVYADHVAALAQNKDCLADFVNAAVQHAAKDETVYGYRLEEGENARRFMLYRYIENDDCDEDDDTAEDDDSGKDDI